MRQTLTEMAQNGRIESLDGDLLTPEAVESDYSHSISHTAHFTERVALGKHVEVGAAAVVGAGVHLGNAARIGHQTHIGNGVVIEDRAILSDRVAVLSNARIGEFAMVGSGVIVGPDVVIPAQAQIGAHMVIPDAHSILTAGPFGTSNRTITIHGAADGPRYSIGCQNSVTEEVIAYRIETGEQTSEESADHYRKYLGVMKDMGRIVQAHWQELADAGVVEQVVQEAAVLSQSTDE